MSILIYMRIGISSSICCNFGGDIINLILINNIILAISFYITYVTNSINSSIAQLSKS